MMTRMLCALFTVISLQVLVTAPAQAADAVEAATVADHMDKTKYSSKEIKSYMKGLKGKDVVAAGKVDNIHGQPRQEAKVVVDVTIPGRGTLFVVDVHMPQSEADKLRKNDRVSCRGQFRRYNPWTLNGIVLQGSCTK